MATRGRQVYNNQVVLDQADIYLDDGFTRHTGITVSALTIDLFYQNLRQGWTPVSGLGVLDTQVSAGKIYWEEIAAAPGFYSVRFRPNGVGYWRLVLTYPSGFQVLAQDYDVTSQPLTVDAGLQATFVKPG